MNMINEEFIDFYPKSPNKFTVLDIPQYKG